MTHNRKWWWDATLPLRVIVLTLLTIALLAWATFKFGCGVPIGLLGVGLIVSLVIFGIVHANDENGKDRSNE